MKIYTKTGDNGSTRLVDGSCVDKFNPRVEAYGTVDELNSHLSLLKHTLSLLELEKCCSTLETIQHKLFVIGSLLATESDSVFSKLPQITNNDIQLLESEIDFMTLNLPEIRNFILPDGHISSIQAHIARTLCRRAERRSAEVSTQDNKLSFCLIYLNRLSDYFFTLARYVNFMTQTNEIFWDKNR